MPPVLGQGRAERETQPLALPQRSCATYRLRRAVGRATAAQTLLHLAPFENASVVDPPSFFSHAFMGKPPMVMWRPSMSSESSISPISGWFPKGHSTDFTELPSTSSVMEPATLGICHLPARAPMPSALLMDPAGMRLPSLAPSLDTAVNRTSASAMAAADNRRRGVWRGARRRRERDG